MLGGLKEAISLDWPTPSEDLVLAGCHFYPGLSRQLPSGGARDGFSRNRNQVLAGNHLNDRDESGTKHIVCAQEILIELNFLV